MILRTISKIITDFQDDTVWVYEMHALRAREMSRLNFSYFLTAAALCLAAGPALSQTLVQREPGLWEIQVDKGSQVADAMKSMAKMLEQMPAAQRQQMEQMMKSSGLSSADPTVIKQCVTPEMAARGFVPYVDEPDMKCTTTTQNVSGTEGRFTFTCQSPQGTFKGNGRILDAAAKSYRSEMTAEGTVSGLPMKMNMSTQAHWLGKDCQGIKPIG